MRPRRFAACGALTAALLGAVVASADPPQNQAPDEEDRMPPKGYVPGHREQPGLGLSPHVPGQQSALPGGVAPSFGAPLRPNEGSKLDFKGYLQAGARASFGKRQGGSDEQSGTTWHGDPVVPRGNVFENPNTVPYTWGELRFSYSLPQVTATVSLGAWALSESMQAAGSFMPNAQLWVRDAFLSYVPKGLDPVKLTWNVGVYEDRYGGMAQYSTGQYGAPLIATIAGVGETLLAEIPLSKSLDLKLEHGIKSSFERAPVDVPTGPTNNWQKPWEGQTFVNHLHAGLDFDGWAQPALHWISAFARDDQADRVPLGNLRAGNDTYDPSQFKADENFALDHADASLQIVAADVRFNLKRWGYLYTGVSHASANHIRSLNGVVQLLNAGGGRDLMDRYFGRNNDQGKGTLTLAGLEYTVGLGELLRYPDEFWGEGPDLKLTVYGMYGHITSDDPSRDGEDKYKLGVEGTYAVLPWLALAGRVDRLVPFVSKPKVPIYPRQNDNSFSVFTLKAVLKSDWQAREALTLQYSRYAYRSQFHLVSLNAGGQISTQSDEPDENLLALYGNLWW